MRYILAIILFGALFSCHKKVDSPDTKVLGHGGESIYNATNKFPPNHFLSSSYALEALGANGVELDVQMTSDSILVLYHDLTLDKNSDGSGCINSMTWAQLDSVQIYNSDYNISRLKDVLEEYAGVREIFLDVKHLNECTGDFIDYPAFNAALNELLVEYSASQKSHITVNSRDINLFSALSDSTLNWSFESDNVNSAIDQINDLELQMITIKLEALSDELAELVKSNGTMLVIYNVKTKSDVYEALQYAPDFVISDNIQRTLKAING